MFFFRIVETNDVKNYSYDENGKVGPEALKASNINILFVFLTKCSKK